MAGFLSKLIFGTSNIYDSVSKLDSIAVGIVENIDDETQAGRIRIRIKGVVEGEGDDKAWAFPLMPKHVQVMPKVGEAVFVFKLSLNDTEFTNRFWMGPIISQPQKLNKDDSITSQSPLLGGSVNVEEAPTKPETKGVFPDKSYISIQGRNNSDITFKDNEILLRAGQHIENQPLQFNNSNMGFFQIKYNTPVKIQNGDEEEDTKLTVANIIAEKIHLLTHNGTRNFALKDRDNLITDEVMSDIINRAHPLPYGDIMVEWMQAAKAFILSHVHNAGPEPPVADQKISDNFIKFDFSRINSKNIKID